MSAKFLGTQESSNEPLCLMDWAQELGPKRGIRVENWVIFGNTCLCTCRRYGEEVTVGLIEGTQSIVLVDHKDKNRPLLATEIILAYADYLERCEHCLGKSIFLTYDFLEYEGENHPILIIN
jgi:hypothetical protein